MFDKALNVGEKKQGELLRADFLQKVRSLISGPG